MEVASIASDLEEFERHVSKIRDKISNAFIQGTISGLLILVLAIGSLHLDIAYIILGGYVVAFLTYRYIRDGVWQFRWIRRHEKTAIAISKAKTMEELAGEVWSIEW